MSRVGGKLISVPGTVKVSVEDRLVVIKGPLGELTTSVPEGITASLEDEGLSAQRRNDSKTMKSLHGLTRSLLANAVRGVTEGFKKELDIVGIGFRAESGSGNLTLSLGFSHSIEFPLPEGIKVNVERANKPIQNYVASLVVEGIDKCQVGQVAANIRALRPPDAYKGKGIRYSDERIRLKVGKKGA
jgi:large subunit ribosomal protein L6